MYLFNKIYVCYAIVDAAPELCQKGDFSPEKSMKGIFAYVLELMFTLDKIQNNSTLM